MIADAHRIFNEALEKHNPTHVFLLTSGGNDSAVPLHLFHKHPRVTAAVHIDTGIKVPEVEPHVKATCDAFGLDLLIYRAVDHTKADGTPDPQRYEDFVCSHGFPGPAQHTRMYNRLKQRQIERLVREHKQEWGDRIMLVTGLRKTESRRRMLLETNGVQREGARVWCNPVLNWTDEQMLAYRIEQNLPESPVARNLGMSGECLCGAFAKPGELDRIAEHYPEVAERIRKLERESGCPWSWESGPDHQWTELKRGQGVLEFHPLCTSCVTRGRAS